MLYWRAKFSMSEATLVRALGRRAELAENLKEEEAGDGAAAEEAV